MLQLILQFILYTLLATFPLNSLLGYKMLRMLYFSEHFRALFHLPILVLIKLVCRKDIKKMSLSVADMVVKMLVKLNGRFSYIRNYMKS